MWKQLTTIGAVTAALGIGPALAQQSPTTQPEQQMQQSQPMEGELTGLQVYSSDGQLLGEVSQVVEGAGGTGKTLQVDIGGFLGIGEKQVEIEPDQYSLEGDRINLSITADEARELPEAMAQ